MDLFRRNGINDGRYPVHGVISIFYRSTKRHGLQMKEMVPLFKKQQLIKCHLLKTSSDPEVRMSYEARTAKEKKLADPNSAVSKSVQNQWRPCVDLEKLLSEVKHNFMFGCGVRSRGLGSDTKLKKNVQKRPKKGLPLYSCWMRRLTSNGRHATQLAHFAESCKWDGIMGQDKPWRTAIYQSNDTLFQWTIEAVEDQCSSP